MLKKVISIILFLGQSVAVAEVTDAASIISARATNKTSKEVFAFLNGEGALKFDSNQQFSKLEMIFRKKLKIDRIAVESCGEPFQDGVDFYINFDEKFKFFEGGKSLVTYSGPAIETAALTLNFRRATELCLKRLVFEIEGRLVEVRAPKLIEAKVKAKAPVVAFQDLFDSKLNSFMKMTAPEKTSTLNIEWAHATEFDEVILWPGNFTTDILFKDYSRPKSVEARCDSLAGEKFELRDEMIPQALKFSKPLTCQNFSLMFGPSYPGRATREMGVTELRFSKNDHIFIPDISTFESGNQKSIEAEFEEADMSPVLERQLTSVETPLTSVFRIHSDGSFFLHGFDELAKENESFYVLGEVVAAAVKKNRINLTLRGLKRSSTLEMDSLSCGRKCFQENDYASEKYFFEQEIQLRRGRDGFYRIDTLGSKKLRRIDFTSIRFLLDHSL